MTATKPVIPPTIGRRVLVFMSTQPTGVTPNNPKVPYDGGIAYAWGESSEKNAINVGFRDHAGNPHGATSVVLYDRPQDENDAHGRTDLGNYAVWMPYQFDQAKRALEPKVTGGQANFDRPADLNLDDRKLEDNGVATDLGLERAAEAAGGATVAQES